MKKLLLLSLVVVPLLTFQGCGKDESSNPLTYVKGNFGHLDRIDLVEKTPMYLVHVDRGENFNVCIAEYLIQDHPGILEEVEASINIWAHYIGRQIPVVTQVMELARPSRSDTDDELTEKYYETCGDVDLVVGKSFFKGSTVGRTNTNYSFYTNSDDRRDVQKFQRGLFLKESNEDDLKKINWITLQQASGKERTAQELQEILTKRFMRVYTSGEDQRLTFRTILHEVGHIWGLCDQYESASNCDPDFSIAKEHESIMGSSSWISKVYLTDDDILGIRKFGDRERFIHSWPTKEDFSQIKINDVWQRNLEFFRFRGVEFEEEKVRLALGIVTNKKFELKVSIHDSVRDYWVNNNPIKYDTAVSYFEHGYTFTLPNNVSADRVKLTFTFKAEQEGEEDKVHSYYYPAEL